MQLHWQRKRSEMPVSFTLYPVISHSGRRAIEVDGMLNRSRRTEPGIDLQRGGRVDLSAIMVHWTWPSRDGEGVRLYAALCVFVGAHFSTL